MTQPPLDYHTPPPNPGASLRIPAILLITFGGLTLLAIALDALSRMVNGVANQGHFTVHFGLTLGPPESTLIINAFSALLTIMMIIGAAQMLRRRNYGLAITGAVIAIIPLTATCCCIFTLPFGIWALIVLLRPGVKASFDRDRP